MKLGWEVLGGWQGATVEVSCSCAGHLIYQVFTLCGFQKMASYFRSKIALKFDKILVQTIEML